MKEKIQILKNFFKIFLPSNTSSAIFRWIATIVFSLILFFAVVTIALIAVLRDREVQIPQRFASKILYEINSLSSPYLVEAGGVSLSLDDGFVPEINISGVDLLFPSKEPLLSFNSFKAKFSLMDIIFGKFRVSSVTLDSANLSIIRKINGSLNLEFGAENISENNNFDILAVLKTLDEYFNVDEMERFLELNLFGLTVQFEDQRAGKIYTIDGARVRLDRQGEALVMGFDLALLLSLIHI